MDNNELDKILKEKLKNKIKPSAEMEGKIRQKVEEEKAKQLMKMNNDVKSKNKKYKRLKPILSIAAAIIIVFAVGMNLNKMPIDIINKNEQISVVNIKAIEPTKAEDGILANDSDFLIYTDGQKTTKEDIQKSIYVEPALDYTIEKVSNEKYKLKFKKNIPDNTIVKLQYIKNKIAEDSWAYQTSNKLSITSTYPDKDSMDVSKNTAIEIKFSYASVNDLEKNVQITPNVKGKWEHLGNIWRFKPQRALKDGQKYTIKINKEISAEGEKLENDYIFSFVVNTNGNSESKYTYNTISADEINNYKSNEAIKIYYDYDNYVLNSTKISKVEIGKFNSADEFIEYIKTKNSKIAKKLGIYKFTKKENYIQLNKTLQNGYYVASVKDSNGNEIFNCPIQINDLSAYAIETERDIVVWVADGKSLTKGIKVEYQGKEQKTNNDGIAKFENVADGSETIKYAKIGNDENKLVIGLYNYDLQNYPNGYLYTDRPLYKNTDTINIWAFVPKELFFDNIEDEFYIEFNNEGKQKVQVDEEGNINYKIELKNHYDSEYAELVLYYKDTIIANRVIEIENYELQNYTYKVIMDKNYVYAGDKFKFDVKVEHITGLAVPNKSVVIQYQDKYYKKITNENGIATFTLNIKQGESLYTSPDYEEITIYNGDASEYVDSENYASIYVLNRNTYTQIDESKYKNYKLTLYKLAKDKKTQVDYELKDIYDGVYDTNVQINLIETVSERQIIGYEYNEYTKQNEPEYSFEEIDKNTKHIKTISTQNGVIEFNANELSLKKDTKLNQYNYELEFRYKDRNGKQVVELSSVYNGDEYDYSVTSLGYSEIAENSGSGDSVGFIPTNINYNDYYIYRYFLKKDKYKFSIGDTVNLSLAESTTDGIKDIENKGELLTIILKENITQTEIIKDNDLNYTFKDDDFPGCKITSAYFYNGKFYRMPVYYFDFDEKDRKVDIEITSDKEEYKPGDKVTLNIKTTNNGKPIKSSVNISVINKAVFELREDTTNILESLYEDKTYPIYTYSSYRDYIKGESGGGGGRRRRDERKLWRYRIFRNSIYKLKWNCKSYIHFT